MKLYKIRNSIRRMFYNRFLIRFNSGMYFRDLHSTETFDGILRTPNPKNLNVNLGVKIVKYVLENNLVNGTVFEFGAGTGQWTKKIMKWGYHIYATDLVSDKFPKLDITKERPEQQYDNVVGIGVLHHIFYNTSFKKALKNINETARKRIILGVKVTSPDIDEAKQRPLKEYVKILGEPILEEYAGYLTMLVFDKV